jgi:hypothetical protein
MTTTTEHTVKPADFFVYQWGYDQTNADFFKVIGVTAKSVRIQPWSRKVTARGVIPGDGPATKPVVDWSQVTATDWEERLVQIREVQTEVDAPIVTKRVQTGYQGRPMLSMEHGIAYVWDGAPQYDTTAMGGAGH